MDKVILVYSAVKNGVRRNIDVPMEFANRLFLAVGPRRAWDRQRHEAIVKYLSYFDYKDIKRVGKNGVIYEDDNRSA